MPNQPFRMTKTAMLRLLILALLSTLSGAVTLHFVTEENPPQNMFRNGEIVGAAADQIKLAASSASLDFDINIMPWARAMRLARQIPNYCVFATARIPSRESSFVWIGPLGSTQWVLYATADHPGPLPSSITELRNEPIAVYNGDVIEQWLSANGYKVEVALEDAMNPAKLLAGRTRYWASNRARATALIAQAKLETRIVPVLVFGGTELFLACHPNTRPELLEQMRISLSKISLDGTQKRIIDKYSE